MTDLRAAVRVILFAALAAGCASAPSPAQPASSSSATTSDLSAVAVTLDGYAGKYVEWSVPTDVETDEDGNFVDCDTDGGVHYCKSWIGDPGGWGGDRYHQGPGQLDRLWILDVDGVRFVIDANWLPSATSEEREELLEIVESIRFER